MAKKITTIDSRSLRDLSALLRTSRDPSRPAPARRKYPVSVGGGGGCETQNTILDITLFGNPTGGTFDVPLEINGVQELMTFNWDDTSTEVATELATHSQLASSDVDVTGGPFPTVTVRIELIGDQAGVNVIPPIADWTDLTGGTGKAIIIAQAQRGHA